jgi:hypothetical protein
LKKVPSLTDLSQSTFWKRQPFTQIWYLSQREHIEEPKQSHNPKKYTVSIFENGGDIWTALEVFSWKTARLWPGFLNSVHRRSLVELGPNQNEHEKGTSI